MRMKLLTCLLPALVLAFASAASARDPFWPLGYHPAAPLPPPPSPPPAGSPAQLAFGPQGITTVGTRLPPPPNPREAMRPDESGPRDADSFESLFSNHDSSTNQWAIARRMLSVDGFMASYSSAGKKQHEIVMINRNAYKDGDVIAITNKAIRFAWKIVLPDAKHFSLNQIEAVDTTADSKKENK